VIQATHLLTGLVAKRLGDLLFRRKRIGSGGAAPSLWMMAHAGGADGVRPPIVVRPG